VVQDALPFCITDGNPGRARGLNLVGLRRNGFGKDEIGALKEAYRLLYSRVPLVESLLLMKAMGSPRGRSRGLHRGQQARLRAPTR